MSTRLPDHAGHGPAASDPGGPVAASRAVGAAAAQNPFLEDLPRKLLWLVVFRAVLATLLVAGTLAAARRAGDAALVPGARPVLLVGGCAYLLTALSVLAMRLVRRWRAFTYAQLLIDLVLWTAIAYVTGGPGGYFVYLIHMVVLMSAVFLGVSGTVRIGLAAAAVYGAMALGLRLELIPWPAGFEPATAVDAAAALSVRRLAPDLISIAGVVVLAGVLAYRAQQVSRGFAAAERARADLTARSEFILQSLPIGIMTTDLEGLVRSVNPEASRLFGRTRADLMGIASRRALGLPLGPHELRSETGDLMIERPDGTPVSVEYSTSTLGDADGEPIGSLWILRDVTEIVAIRRELGRVERLSALGRLAASLAHEIRNPLGAIRGAVELLSRPDGTGPADGPARPGAAGESESALLSAIVIREVDRINDLVGQMLVLARPLPPERHRVLLGTIVDEVATLARHDARSTRSRLEIDVQDGTPPVDIDPSQIRQTLWNLVKNALQAAAAGTVRVCARAVEGGAELSVDDSGAGVPEGDRERIFELFYTGKAYGVGIGLAICRQIIAAHGGRIRVERSDLGGASFRVFLPAGRSSPSPEPPADVPPDVPVA